MPSTDSRRWTAACWLGYTALFLGFMLAGPLLDLFWSEAWPDRLELWGVDPVAPPDWIDPGRNVQIYRFGVVYHFFHLAPFEPILIAVGGGALAGLLQWLYLRRRRVDATRWLGHAVGGLDQRPGDLSAQGRGDPARGLARRRRVTGAPATSRPRGPGRRHARGPLVVLATGVGPLLLVLLTACGGSILGTDPDTGLEVEVRKGPIDPVGQPGEDNTAPVEDARVRIHRTDGDGSLRVQTDADGRARVPLEPGSYEITVEACPGALALPEAATVTVQSGRITRVRLVCDTGIR